MNAAVVDFTSVRNHTEAQVFAQVRQLAGEHPGIADNADLLADVACVALNRLQPRYIRHAVDFSFYLSDSERESSARAVADAVRSAFGFVQARAVLGARG